MATDRNGTELEVGDCVELVKPSAYEATRGVSWPTFWKIMFIVAASNGTVVLGVEAWAGRGESGVMNVAPEHVVLERLCIECGGDTGTRAEICRDCATAIVGEVLEEGFNEPRD